MPKKPKKSSDRAITGMDAIKYAVKKDYSRLKTKEGRSLLLKRFKQYSKEVQPGFGVSDEESDRRRRKDYPGLYKKK